MAKKTYEFVIDDTLSAKDNLAVLAQQLGKMDAPLAAVLTPHLARLTAASTPDASVIWNELFDATVGAPGEDMPEPNEDVGAAG